MTGFVANNTPNPQRPTFFFDQARRCDMVEIVSITDTKSTVIKRVSPEVISQFQKEWDAYCAGRPSDDIGGTPLNEVPGLERNAITMLGLKGIRNAEELASLTDSMAQQLGMGVLAWSRTARLLINSQKYEALDAETSPKSKVNVSPRKTDKSLETVDSK
jgi:hypothetical protein